MSGGRPSGPQTAVGDHPSCTSEARKDGETAGCARTPDLIRGKGLVLTAKGVADPKKERESQPARAGIRSAQGVEAEWPRPPKVGSVHDSPTRGDANSLVGLGKISLGKLKHLFAHIIDSKELYAYFIERGCHAQPFQSLRDVVYSR